MQTLEIISVNLWSILISLINLVLLFLIFKFFLYKPVKKVMAQRQQMLDDQYNAAANAKKEAEEDRALWKEKLDSAHSEADSILKSAVSNADIRSEAIVDEAKKKADVIIRQAEIEAELERKKVEAEIKTEIIDVSTVLASKMLDREINSDDHRNLIDSFIESIGDGE